MMLKVSGKAAGVVAMALVLSGPAMADQYQLVTGVNAGMAPGSARSVFPVPGSFVPGTFFDGQRLAGLSNASPTTYLGTGTPVIGANEFGSLSFAFRRGSVPTGQASFPQIPLMSIDYLGGPLLDADGDLGNGSRRLTPQVGQTPVLIPGTQSFVDLAFNPVGGTVALNHFDASGSNAGSDVNTADQVVTVNVLAGTSVNGVAGAGINPSIDTRQGTLTPVAPGLTRIDNLGYEVWQDSLSAASSQAATLGTVQFLGALSGWRFERDGSGQFPDLSAVLLGTTPWPAVNTSQVGNSFATASHPFEPFATITDHIEDNTSTTTDDFTHTGNGGEALTDFADLADYFTNIVYPAIDPNSQSFVYLASVGFGINNSFDPVFGDSVGYDLVLVAQSVPIPEPSALMLLAGGALVALRRRQRLS